MKRAISKKKTRTKKYSFKENKFGLAKKISVYFLLAALLTVGGAARFYGLKSNLHFDIDEAAHITTIKQIYEQKKFITQGPPSSIESKLHHGAYFYYLYLPSVAAAKGNPLGPAVFTILLSLATIPLLYFALMPFGRKIAVCSVIIYSLSGVIIQYGRWAWNPNLIPFFFTLAMFALARLNEKRPWYLVLFLFSLGSISQLHIGSLFLPVVALPLLPYLISLTKNKIVWALAIIAFLVPAVPTIVFEAQNHFEIIGAIKYIWLQPHAKEITFLGYLDRGYNYFANIFSQTTRFSQEIFIISIAACLGFFATKIKDFHKSLKIILPLFLFLSFAYLFFAASFYPDTLFVHFAEELLILFPVALGILLGVMAENAILIAPVVFAIFLFSHSNWIWYQKNIVFGEQQFKVEKQICQIVKESGEQNIQIYINDRRDPIFISYICKNFYSIKFGEGRIFEFVTNYQNRLEYKR